LRVEIDRERAANLGVSTTDIADALRIMVGGDDRVTRFRDESMNEDYDVQVRSRKGPQRPEISCAALCSPIRTAGWCGWTMS
jgi:hydrophobic/amphiphilic exporter-1 (mainly G- bacteria), HAE1 family